MRPLLGALVLVSLGGCLLRGDRKRSPSESHASEREEASVTAAACDDLDPNEGLPPDLGPAPTATAGKLADRFQISPNGAAVYTIPISVPPGRAGIEPSLALSYSSDAPNGIAGVGVSLQGLSLISRCPLNVAEDDRNRDVSYDAEDRFCLDGQRLVSVKGGDYGANSTEYRTRPDTFAKIVGHTTNAETGPYKFTVYTKDGRILTYGDDGDPFQGVSSSNGASVLGTSVVRAWALQRVEDRSGNYMKIQYTRRSGQVDGVSYTTEQVPQNLRYTGHGSTAPTRVVNLNYEPRPDPWSGYTKGMRVESSLRLSNIDVRVGFALARSYQLTYGLSRASGRSRVEQIEECGTDGVCKPPTVLAWNDAPDLAAGPFYAPFGPVDGPNPQPLDAEATYLNLDVNGDGRDDIVYPQDIIDTNQPATIWRVAMSKREANGGGFTEPRLDFSRGHHPRQQATPLDYNGDGQGDLLLHDTTSLHWTVLLGWSQEDSIEPGFLNDPENPGYQAYLKPVKLEIASSIRQGKKGSFHIADMNGDGLADLIQCEPPIGQPGGLPNFWYYYENTGAGFSPQYEIIRPLTFRENGELHPVACNQPVVSFDADGDGAFELLVKETADVIDLSTYRAVTRKLGIWSAFDSKVPLNTSTFSDEESAPMLAADVNGDGLKDIVRFGLVPQFPGDDGGFYVHVFENRGGDFAASYVASNFEISPAVRQLVMVLDANEDGREDLLVPPSGVNAGLNWQLFLSTGSSFRVVDSGIPFEYRLDAIASRNQGLRATRSGAIYGISNRRFVQYKPVEQHPDSLVAVHDGFSPSTASPPREPSLSIVYDRLESTIEPDNNVLPNVYLKSICYTSSPLCVASHKRVVADYRVADEETPEGNLHHLYYRGARYDRPARRWLGFAQKLDFDVGNKVYAWTKYSLGAMTPSNSSIYAQLGEPEEVNVLSVPRSTAPDGLGTPTCSLHRVKRTLDERLVYGGATFFSFAQRTVETDHEFACDNVPVRLGDRQGFFFTDSFLVGPAMRGFYTTYEVDDYGNVTKATTDVSGDTVMSSDVVRTTVDRSYEPPNEANWLVARPSSEQVCGHAPIDDAAQRDKCRLTVMETNPNTGLLSKMTIGAHDPARSLETVPEYDVYGNVVATVATDLGSLEQRSVCTRYDDEGTYPLASVNALGHVTRRRWDARHGALLESGLVD